MTEPLGPIEIVVLLIGSVLTLITSRWSRVSTTTRMRLALIGLLVAFMLVPNGFSEVKAKGWKYTFLFGEGKAAMFYGWAFGLWFSLVLCRSDRNFLKYGGYISAFLFSLFLGYVISCEYDLVFNAGR